MTMPTLAMRMSEARLMDQVRARTLAVVAHLGPADLERVLNPR
jgi:hypothetical protein